MCVHYDKTCVQYDKTCVKYDIKRVQYDKNMCSLQQALVYWFVHLFYSKLLIK
jgi:hypothetical protein